MPAQAEAAPPLLPIQMAPGVDTAPVRDVFQRHGRAHLPGFLTESAANGLYRCLRDEVDWRLSFNLGDRNANLSSDDIAKLADVDRMNLNRHMLATAQGGFQYVFGNWPVYDLWTRKMPQPALLNELMAFLNSERFLDFGRRATGIDDIALADAQLTRYGPGHFLTNHTDDVPAAKRRAAYVINLTPRWMPDWGGILQFYDADGHVTGGYTPSFNALNMFRVPQPHSVTYVSPFTATYRFSISGWFRAA